MYLWCGGRQDRLASSHYWVASFNYWLPLSLLSPVYLFFILSYFYFFGLFIPPRWIVPRIFGKYLLTKFHEGSRWVFVAMLKFSLHGECVLWGYPELALQGNLWRFVWIYALVNEKPRNLFCHLDDEAKRRSKGFGWRFIIVKSIQNFSLSFVCRCTNSRCLTLTKNNYKFFTTLVYAVRSRKWITVNYSTSEFYTYLSRRLQIATLYRSSGLMDPLTILNNEVQHTELNTYLIQPKWHFIQSRGSYQRMKTSRGINNGSFDRILNSDLGIFKVRWPRISISVSDDPEFLIQWPRKSSITSFPVIHYLSHLPSSKSRGQLTLVKGEYQFIYIRYM